MTEYIVEIPEEPAKIVRDGWNFRIDWQYKQREEIVRCRDCKHFHASMIGNTWCARLLDIYGNSLTFNAKPEDYCAWGEREIWTMCKCGEEIELGNRESAVCPSCGRTVRE